MLILLAALLLLAQMVSAQTAADGAIRDAVRWSDPRARDIGDKVSTGMVVAAVALPCILDRTLKCVKHEAVHVVGAVALAELAKLFVHRERPNGVDKKSWFSEHTTIACAATFGTKFWAVCPAVGYMRMATDWHWGSDVGTGAFVGAAMTYVW